MTDEEADIKSIEILVRERDSLRLTIEELRSETMLLGLDHCILYSENDLYPSYESLLENIPECENGSEFDAEKSRLHLMEREMKLQEAELERVEKEFALATVVQHARTRCDTDIERLAREEVLVLNEINEIASRISESHALEGRLRDEIVAWSETIENPRVVCLEEPASILKNRKAQLVVEICEMNRKISELNDDLDACQSSFDDHESKLVDLQACLSAEQSTLEQVIENLRFGMKGKCSIQSTLEILAKKTLEKTTDLHELEFKNNSVSHTISSEKAYLASLSAERELLEAELAGKDETHAQESELITESRNKLLTLQETKRVKLEELENLKGKFSELELENRRLISLVESSRFPCEFSDKCSIERLESEFADATRSRQYLSGVIQSTRNAANRLRRSIEVTNREIKDACDKLVLAEIGSQRIFSEIQIKRSISQKIANLENELKKHQHAVAAKNINEKKELSELKEKQKALDLRFQHVQQSKQSKREELDAECKRSITLRDRYSTALDRKRDLFSSAKYLSDEIVKNINEIDRLKFLILNGERTKIGISANIAHIERCIKSLMREESSANHLLESVVVESKSISCEQTRLDEKIAESDIILKRKKVELSDIQRELCVIRRVIPKISAFKESLLSLQSQLKVLQTQRSQLEAVSDKNKQVHILPGEDDTGSLQLKIKAAKQRLQDRNERIIESGLLEEELARKIEALKMQARENSELMAQFNFVKSSMYRQSRKLIATIGELEAVNAKRNTLLSEIERDRSRLIECRANMDRGLPPCEEAEGEFRKQLRVEKIKKGIEIRNLYDKFQIENHFSVF